MPKAILLVVRRSNNAVQALLRALLALFYVRKHYLLFIFK